MNVFLELSFLFFIGSTLGWVIELFYRRFFSRMNTTGKWINPGFCTGPYLPLYGSGLCVMFITARIGERINVHGALGILAVTLIMGALMTVLEYASGLLVIKLANVRLWDYSQERFNFQGIICLKFSIIWTACSALYYLLIHKRIINALIWLSDNLAFSFVIGLFFGVFIIDVCYNAHIVAEIKKYADEKQIIVRYEHLKAQIIHNHEMATEKTHFLFPFKSPHTIREHLKENRDVWEVRVKKFRKIKSDGKKGK